MLHPTGGVGALCNFPLTGHGPARRVSNVLRTVYKRKPCSWMHKPTSTRYARTKSKVRPPPRLLECVHRLFDWQEAQQLYFVLFEGEGLAAQVAGGFHGNADDWDMDVRMASRLYPSVHAHCGKHLGDVGEYIPGFDIVRVPRNRHQEQDKKHAQIEDELDPDESVEWRSKRPHKHARAEALARTELVDVLHDDSLHGYPTCICEWEEIEVLCVDSRKSDYYFRAHGGSLWVPPVSGGKDLGHARLPHFFKPPDWESYSQERGIYTRGHGRTAPGGWSRFEWLELTMQGLTSLDANQDRQIDTAEFMQYVRASTRVNQVWLHDQMANNRCVVTNAQIHYNHTLHYARLGAALRRACGDDGKLSSCRENRVWTPSCGAQECHDTSWDTFQRLWVPPPYKSPCHIFE